MQLGEIVANTLAILLLVCFLASTFFLFGKPLWPEQHARMVIIVPVDTMTTASTGRGDTPVLPATFDASLAHPRPS
ncbi:MULTISPECIES: polymerase [unclassified Mesorhizobium]|uniref:polymerase n=1 Tax=unclassified Mesorhizobium TaxID=325217 RepID=UPI0011294D2A|nr:MULTISPECIES: polymerase [unclassified Mesorhizobium]MBZ9743542.1 polymerase [Mesorhizobium sp. CO1-1-4]MBZ9804822.1 polymerase [Mesorhizobium sp. ES1-6]MBZ9995755.1 polymerase [Mesorhizobium sp. BH1-1-4]TPL86168.1 polymerase [Mesorhizobium sp. B2-3-12]